MAPPKRKAIEIIDLINDDNPWPNPHGRPLRPNPMRIQNLISQAPTVQVAPQATARPMAVPHAKSSRLQYRPHHRSVTLRRRVQVRSRAARSRPPTPVGTWQSGPVARRHSLPASTRTEQWTPINRPPRAYLTAPRDVQRRDSAHVYQPALKRQRALDVLVEDKRGSCGAATAVAGPLARSMGDLSGMYQRPPPSSAPGPVRMIPMNAFASRNGFVPVNGLPNVSAENASGNLGQPFGQALPSVPKPGTQPASQPGSQHNVGTPPSKPRNFSVVINSGPRPKIPPHMIFDCAASDEEPAPKTPSKSAPGRELPKESTTRKARSRRIIAPKENGQAPNSKPAPAKKLMAKKRGRPFKNGQAAAAKEKVSKKPTSKFSLPKDFDTPIPLPEAKYNVWYCEWKGCPAELHNLETLRRHIFKEHNNKLPCGSRECLWDKCAAPSDTPDEKKVGEDSKPTTKFATKKEWQDHIEKHHITPIAWQLGDGPKIPPITAESLKQTEPSIPDWLCDRDGIQVTPSLVGQPIEDGDITEMNRKRYKPTRMGLDIVYEPVMDRKLWWKMPDDPDYMLPREGGMR